MTIYIKLNLARREFHSLKLTKSGHNKFAGYKYFELADFLIPAMDVLSKYDLCAIVSFTKDIATMKVINIIDNQSFEITSPMGSAALKGCHEVQNVGAVETYQRRYLWVALLEIVEHDALDAVTGSKEGEPVAVLSEEDKRKIAHDEYYAIYKTSVLAIKDAIAKDDNYSAAEAWRELDEDVQRGLWIAPTKGGCFTTPERDYLKNKLPKAEIA